MAIVDPYRFLTHDFFVPFVPFKGNDGRFRLAELCSREFGDPPTSCCSPIGPFSFSIFLRILPELGIVGLTGGDFGLKFSDIWSLASTDSGCVMIIKLATYI